MREESVGKLAAFKGRITVVPGATNHPEVIRRAVAGCDGVLVVLVPRGVHGYSTGTAQAVLDRALPGAWSSTAWPFPSSTRRPARDEHDEHSVAPGDRLLITSGWFVLRNDGDAPLERGELADALLPAHADRLVAPIQCVLDAMYAELSRARRCNLHRVCL